MELVNDGPVTLLLEGPGGAPEAAGTIWPMYLEAFSDNPYGTNCWLLAREGSEEALVVDPGFDGARVLALLEAASKRPVAALATHGHDDHVGSAAAVCGTELPLYIHKDDELALTDPDAWGRGSRRRPNRPADLRTFVDGDVLELAGLVARGRAHPGPHPGERCFRLTALLFSGDLVFRGSIGRSTSRTRPDGRMVAQPAAVPALPDDLDVHPGHLRPSTTVGHERRRTRS